ncbi:uncharacterized protein EI90DRAFT_2946480 [Cantharellus anzutake]|uniref:uncharacterized protein n=1 Tax=Cantharellus anzutake TaxID=1750568 RepID=UPI001906FC86|nr:uncharacterized protein EI90DRAFT_2946480 [Cantharellus anzutake]KAF8315482.1 hypothetical protein EI90DRAFT_2946480 [Cantharellus anzutake]
MFNSVESRYSQPKLELYGVLHAFKAERHHLYNIHFKLQVDASALIQMINSPNLPNAAMTFEIEHNPADKHKAPDGLSRHRQADEDSDFSDGEIAIEEGVKFLKLLDLKQDEDFCEMSMAEFLTEEIDPCETSKINET